MLADLGGRGPPEVHVLGAAEPGDLLQGPGIPHRAVKGQGAASRGSHEPQVRPAPGAPLRRMRREQRLHGDHLGNPFPFHGPESHPAGRQHVAGREDHERRAEVGVAGHGSHERQQHQQHQGEAARAADVDHGHGQTDERQRWARGQHPPPVGSDARVEHVLGLPVPGRHLSDGLCHVLPPRWRFCVGLRPGADLRWGATPRRRPVQPSSTGGARDPSAPWARPPPSKNLGSDRDPATTWAGHGPAVRGHRSAPGPLIH